MCAYIPFIFNIFVMTVFTANFPSALTVCDQIMNDFSYQKERFHRELK